MIHYPLSRISGHYACNHNGGKDAILVQIQEDLDQVRAVMTVDEAEHLLSMLQTAIQVVKSYTGV